MSTAPEPARPTNDGKAASIAWAIAAIVVALVVAFIAWLAMGDRGGSDSADPGTSPAPTAQADPDGAEATDGDDAAAVADETGAADAVDPTTGPDAAGDPAQDPGGDAAEQSPPPEVEEFMLSLQRRDADDPMAVGDVDAPVVMIEYADYRCPYCARFATQTRPELDPLIEDGTLRVEFRDLVIFQETSELAAVAARAAAAQDHLSDYQQELFALSLEGQADFDREDLIELAEQVGIPDLDAFETALDDEEIRAAVQTDTDEARAIGITSTPSFLVNTQVVQGAYPVQHFEQVIEAERQKAEQAED